jgi:hypothetical protein
MADNPSSRFKFISPGVFVDEIDNSQLPAEPGAIGPVVIGRARKGPAMVPVQVNSFSDFVDTFGTPVPGPEAGDVWRNGDTQSPHYGAYAAQAYLRNNAPLTYVRLVGQQEANATDDGKAGFKAGSMAASDLANVANGGAWGVFVWPSGVLGGGSVKVAEPVTGALAAVVYCEKGRIVASGSTPGANLANLRVTASACTLFESDASGHITLAHADTAGGGLVTKARVNFDSNSDLFIRKILNTNPTLCNTAISKGGSRSGTMGQGNLWLGESYEHSLAPSGTNSIGVVSKTVIGTKFNYSVQPLRNRENVAEVGNDFQFAAQKGTTGVYFSQDLGTNGVFQVKNQQELFRFEALTAGAATQNEVKISLANIKAPKGDFEQYGTFSVLVRQLSDTDNAPVIIERFDSLDLNPASPNYIAKVIGDKYEQYDTNVEDNRTYGQYDNRSKYIRVVMDEDVDAGITDPRYLPFGVFGPLKYRNCAFTSGSNPIQFARTASSCNQGRIGGGENVISTLVDGGSGSFYGFFGGYDILGGASTTSDPIKVSGSTVAWTGSIAFPSVPVRKTNVWGQPKNLKSCFWGAYTGRTTSDTVFNPSIIDMLRPRASGLQSSPAATTHDVAVQDYAYSTILSASSLSASSPVEIAWAFTLDDVSGSLAEGFTWHSGSRQNGTSLSAVSSSYSGTLNAGIDRFTTLLHGGYEGFDVKERDPFRDSNSSFTTKSDPKQSYQLATLKRAINVVSDPEKVQMNLATIPGILQQNVTQQLLSAVEERGDALAIIDLRKVYDASSENSNSFADRNAYNIDQLVDGLKDRNINSSYGAAYAPWVRIQDTISGRSLWAPPSVVALGALSNTDRNAFPWFAPAGFNRGGLSEGDAGLPVIDVSKRLSSDDRDRLYENNINPIAKFPAEGIVIFGQKTLQQTRSALDRINVRRLMIFLKREISFIASRLLFEQNTRDTWKSFLSQATPILEEVKTQFGITDFRLTLDESTTTPDLIDRNVIYAKLLVKPTRTVEFFAIDFVVTNSGASFED